MKVFVCVDDNFGMAFNKRRQSRDSAVVKAMVDMVGNGRIFMNSYSAKLFKEKDITVDESFLDLAEDRDFCFVENVSLEGYEEKISEIILFKWNRIYPSDVKLNIDLDNRKLVKTFSFVGNSHDLITCEVWAK